MKSIHRIQLAAAAAGFCLLGACKEAAPAPAGTAKPPREPQRFAWVTGLNPAKEEYYKELHANPWPSVRRKIHECNIRNYSIYQREIDGKLYLFSYLEYIGDNFDADMKRMADDPETQRWWKETDPCQLPLPDAAAAGKIWSDVEEVFHQP